MPNKQKHRGQQSDDSKLFNEKTIPILNQAVTDLSYLMTRGYSDKGSVKLVGDRYRLTKRQRNALQRASCSNQSMAYRKEHEVSKEDIKGEWLAIDGYNLLITLESALAGGIIIDSRDDSIRDIASLHGTYRKVEENHSRPDDDWQNHQ